MPVLTIGAARTGAWRRFVQWTATKAAQKMTTYKINEKRKKY